MGGGRFIWLFGGYCQNDEITIPMDGGYVSYGRLSAAIPIPIHMIVVGTNPKTALAAFGQVGYQQTSLKVMLGGRWSSMPCSCAAPRSLRTFGWRHYATLGVQVAMTAEWGAELFDTHFDPVVLKLIGLLKKALPDCPDRKSSGVIIP